MANDPTTPDHAAPKAGFMLGGSYDKAKQTALIWLPLLAAFYSTVATLWGLGYIGQVVGTITAINVLLGATVAKSSSNYNKSDAKFDGTVVTTRTDDGVKYTLQLNDNVYIDKIDEHQQLLFKVE